jgi:SAM-dependent methyltransferase
VVERNQLSWQDRYQRFFFNREKGWTDGTEEFHDLCRATCFGKILEIGSGPSNLTSRFLSTLGQVYGLDPDEAVTTNDALFSATLLQGNRFPFSNEAFDCCVSNYVCEHVTDPVAHLAEVERVLRPGGAYVFRTVNRFHYVALVASLTPHWFHRTIANRLRVAPSEAHDPYPTHYRMNTASVITRTAALVGLRTEELHYVEKEPSYGRFSRIAFVLLTGYERLVNSGRLLQGIRANLFVVLRKDSRKLEGL